MNYTNSSRKTVLSDYEHNPLIRLVFACGAGYIMLHLAKIVIFMWGQVPVLESTRYFYDKILVHFALQPIDGMLQHPWTILTYMFTGLGFFKLFTSMVWLLLFGNVMQQLTGKSEVVPLFLLSNIVGGIAFVALQQYFPLAGYDKMFVGADAAILGLALGGIVLAPKYKVYFTSNLAIPLWGLVVVYVILNIVVLYGTKNYPLAGLSVVGALTGMIYARMMKGGIKLGELTNRNWARMMKGFMPKKKSVLEDKDEIRYDLDSILDKINEKGMRSLTKGEKEFLQHHNDQ